MNKYDSYKDSGIEWIGEIPSHWDVNKLFRLFKINTGFTPSTSNSEFYENGHYDWINISDLESKYVSTSKTKLTDKAIEGKEIVPKGSLLYSFKLSVGKMAFADKDLFTNEAIFSIFPDDEINLNYYYYLLDRILIHNSNENIYGAKILNQELIKASKLIVPSKEEQTTISNYLDQKTTQIDDLIAKKERLIQLLEEERTAIINQAVTKGLDPTVPMKDSGIEWLGEIPAHWEVKRIKYIGKIISGYSFKSEDFTQTGVRVMKISNIQTMRVDWTDDSYLPENFLTEYERFKINKGDLVFALTRPIISTGIKATIVNEQEKILLNQRNAVLKSGDKLNVRWMYYMIFNEKFKEHFESLIDGTGQQPNISSNDIANINIPLPELNEQNEIVQFLDSKMENVETIISKYQKEIELLKEYKTALISEVVTGKVDVREEIIN